MQVHNGELHFFDMLFRSLSLFLESTVFQLDGLILIFNHCESLAKFLAFLVKGVVL